MDIKISRKSKISEFPSAYYIEFFSLRRDNCIIICFVVFVCGWDKIFKAECCIGFKLARNGIETIGSWVSIFDILVIGDFPKGIIALTRSRTKPYFFTCSLRIFINSYSLFWLYDWLGRQGEIVLAKMAFTFRLVLCFFIVSELYLRLISIGFNFIVSIVDFIELAEGLKAGFIIVLVVMSILELINVADIREVLSIGKAFSL